MSPSPYARLPEPVDPATCAAAQAAPPQSFAPGAESPATTWALLQRDVEG